MTPEEIVNLSLSNLTFSYNLKFATFKRKIVQDIHTSSQILDGTINTSIDFKILTNNNFLASFQIHAIFLHEALKMYSKRDNRNFKSPADLLQPIRQFIGELRHAHAHLEDEDLKFIWDSNKGKKNHTFQIYLPITKTAEGIKYDPDSTNIREFSWQVTPKEEIQLNHTFIMEIIIFSFHIREIFKSQDLSNCDQFLKTFKSSWK